MALNLLLNIPVGIVVPDVRRQPLNIFGGCNLDFAVS